MTDLRVFPLDLPELVLVLRCILHHLAGHLVDGLEVVGCSRVGHPVLGREELTVVQRAEEHVGAH